MQASSFAASIGTIVALFGCGDGDTSGTGGSGGSPSATGAGGDGPSMSTASNTTGGEGGAPSTTTTSSTGGEGGAPSTTSTQSSGGGGEGGGATLCTPGADEPCYNGPLGTEGQGACIGGTHTCNQDGTAFGPCEGEVVPVAETCNTPIDDDCDGATNEDGDGCVCVPNGVASCYSGPPASIGVGVCVAGMAMCNGDGTSVGPCMGDVLPGTESCATSVDLNCDGVVAPTCTGSHVWSKQFGDTEQETPVDITADSAGNVVLTGRFNWRVNFGGGNLNAAGSNDVFVAKLDASGNHLWSKRYGAAGSDGSTALAVDPSGNVAFGGYYSGTVNFGGSSFTSSSYDSFLVKLDAAGNHLWSKTFPDGDGDDIHDLASDPAGNVIAVGSFIEMVDVGGGPFTAPDAADDGFIVKLDAAGNHLWSKHIYAIGDQMADLVTTDAAGNVYVTGRLYSQAIDFGGGFVYGGAFVVKYDPDGNHIWSGAWPHSAKELVVDSAGNCYLTGNFGGTLDFGGGPLTSVGGQDIYLVKLDASGNHVWSQRFGSSNDQLAPGLVVDSAGNIILAGGFYNSINFGGGTLTSTGGERDVFVAKLAPDGSHLWSKHFGDDTGQRALALGLDPTDHLLVMGDFLDDLSFGGPTLDGPSGPSNMFVAKLTP